MTFGPARKSGPAGAGAMFERALAALAGTTIQYRLDAGGTLVLIEDEAAQWARFVATIAAIGDGDEAHSRDAAAIAAVLTTLPVDKRREILSEPIAAVLAPADAERGAHPATRTTIPAQSSLDISANIAGTVSATETTAALTIITEGEGPVAIPGEQPSRIHIRRTRQVEKATGLLHEAREETTTDAVIGGRPAHQIIINVTTLTLAVP